MNRQIKLISLVDKHICIEFDTAFEYVIIKDEYYYVNGYSDVTNLKSYHIYDMNDKYNGLWNSENFITEVEYRNRLIKEILND